MKRYNKINSRWIILGIVCPILAFLFSMNVTYAFFTATAKNSNAVNKTGLIKIMFDPITKQLNTTDISGTAQVFPGDTLNINGSLLNDGNNDCYAILEFEVYVQKYGASTKETAVHKYYAYEGSTLKEITGMSGAYSTYATIISSTSGSNRKSFNLSYKFDGEKYNNSYKKATVTYAVNGYAIQTANVSQTKATEELLNTAGYKYLRVYGNSVQNGTPSPANPVEIQSVGERTKNLANVNSIKNQNIVVSEDGSTITMPIATASNGNTNTDTTLSELCPDLKVGDTAVLSFTTSSNYNSFIYLRLSGITWSSGKSKEITQNDLDSQVYLYGNNDLRGETKKVEITNFMIELGSTATEHEPYGYKIPISVKSKNLFHDTVTRYYGDISLSDMLQNDGSYKLDPVSQFGFWTETNRIPFNGKENQQYTISAKLKCDTVTNIAIGFIYSDGTSNYNTSLRQTNTNYFDYTFTSTAGKTVVSYGFLYGNNGSAYVKDLQIEKGETATEYEPYVSPSTTYVYLDEPLRKVGDYADYIDLQTGTLVRQIRHLELAVADMNNSDAYPGWSNDTTAILNSDYPNQNNQLNYITTIATNVHPDSKGIGINTLNSNKILFLDKGTFNLTQTEWIANYPDLVFKLDYGLQTPETTTIDVPDLGQFSGSVIEVGTTVQPSSTISSNETQLTSEYQELDYITMQNNSSNGYSNGILTDITFANSDRIEMSFSSSDTSNSMMFFCGYTNTVTQPYVALTTSGYSLQSFDSITANQELTRAQASDGTVRTLSFDYTATSTNKIYFGAWSDVSWSRTVTWYSFKIWKRGSIIANFVPCYRKSDNVIGMYDTVSGSFYTNAGTGTFLKGANV